MPETAAVEAVRAAQMSGMNAAQAQATMDPAAVDAFQEAMAPTPVPFIDQLGATWKAAQINNQEHIARMSKLAELSQSRPLTVAQMTAFQYELQTMNFQMEVTTLVAKKTTDMVSTLVKNG